MAQLPEAHDYTRIIRHRSKIAMLSDFDVSGLPGGGLDAFASVSALIFAALLAVPGVPLWNTFVPNLPTVLVALPILVLAFAFYWWVQRDTEGRDNPIDRILLFYVRLRQPKAIASLDADKSPTKAEWQVIIMREPGAPGPRQYLRRHSEYRHIGRKPTPVVQCGEWPAADEPLDVWRFRAWLEEHGEQDFLEDDEDTADHEVEDGAEVGVTGKD